jgi:hypothetical protein
MLILEAVCSAISTPSIRACLPCALPIPHLSFFRIGIGIIGLRQSEIQETQLMIEFGFYHFKVRRERSELCMPGF